MDMTNIGTVASAASFRMRGESAFTVPTVAAFTVPSGTAAFWQMTAGRLNAVVPGSGYRTVVDVPAPTGVDSAVRTHLTAKQASPPRGVPH